MKIYFYIILSSNLLFGQILSDQYTTFLQDSSNSDLHGLYIFDTNFGSLTNDHSEFGVDLTDGGSVGDSITSESVLVENGNSVYFDGTDDQYTFIETLPDSGAFQTLIRIESSYTTQNRVINAFDGSSNRFYVQLTWSSGQGKYQVVIGLYDVSLRFTGLYLQRDKWYLLTLKYKNGNFNLYVAGDGEYMKYSSTYTQADFALTTVSISPAGNRFKGEISFTSIHADTLSCNEKSIYNASGWNALNNNTARANWGFNQGIVSDTIYYASVLTSDNWSITLSDSAASSVNYEVLTSADATTWTTLASGTTGTSWGSKSYSGTGSGYIAVSVASGTAFFDDLIVTRGNNNKFKYNKHSIHSTYLK